MNFNKILLVTILMVFTFSCQVFAEDASPENTRNVYLGICGGIESIIASKALGPETEALTIGFTAKYLPGRLGIGLSYSGASHDVKEGVPLLEEYIKTIAMDFMVKIAELERIWPYAFLSAGWLRVDHEYEGGNEGYCDDPIYGGGIGTIVLPSDNRDGIAFGGEIRYVRLPEDWNADGILQAYLTLGLAF